MQYLLFFLCALLPVRLAARQADISYFICDLKYSKEQGVKICELQQGTLSFFRGYAYLIKEPGYVQKEAARTIAKWQLPIFYLEKAVPDTILKKAFKELGAKSYPSYAALVEDPAFLELAQKLPLDPLSIYDHKAILIAKPQFLAESVEQFQKSFPGVILLDAANYPYWEDKYKMTLLFTENPVLEKIKPFWKLYNKSTSTDLAEQIKSDFTVDTLVIKPRSAFRGEGVIILKKEELQKTLATIFGPKKALRTHANELFRYWAEDAKDSFIVEAFCPSDPVPFPEQENKLFDPTMRAVFVLSHHLETVEMDIIEMHWNLPHHALSDSGTLNDLHKSFGQPPYFVFTEDSVKAEIECELREAIPLAYKKMIHRT